MNDARQRRIVREIHDHAARYGGPHCTIRGMGVSDAARYVVEGHIPDATREEWDWVVAYIEDHPEVLAARPAKLPREIEAERKTEAGERSKRALDHYCAGEYAEALDEIEQCRWLAPGSGTWDLAEAKIRVAMVTAPA